MKLLYALLILIVGKSLFGQMPSGNLVQSCQGKWSCEIREMLLFTEQDNDMEYEIEYSYQCLGHPIEVGVELGEAAQEGYMKKVFERGVLNHKISLQGSGSLKVKDFDPSKTNKAFLNNCRIEVHAAKIIGPSQTEIKKWKEQKEKIEHEILNYRASSQGFFELTTIANTFQSIENLFELSINQNK
jgi:hypothetical protein